MNWFTKLFKSKSLKQIDHDFFDGFNAFKIGKNIWNESVLAHYSSEYREEKIKEALKFFDKAIENGYAESEVFSLRGSCLNDLGFYFDALEDYNKAIHKNPQKGIADNYFMRSQIKGSIFDFEGSLADIKEAIHLSKLDNDDTKYWNNYAKTTGFKSAADFYDWPLKNAERKIELEKKSPTLLADKNTELEKIKRR
jgi:tetratricopeptide (TPR) repeat protein